MEAAKLLEHKILWLTVSMATLNCMQNTRIQYLVISFIGDILYIRIIFKNFRTRVGSEVLEICFTILPGHILYMEYGFEHVY